MLPVLTGVRIEIDGSTIALLATDRFRLSHRELTWNPQHPRRVGGRPGPGQGPRRHRQVADRRRRGHHRALPAAAPARASSASRATRPAACAAPPRACSTASSPRSAACSPAEHRPRRLVDKAALIESVKRVSLVAERNTAVQLAFSDGVLTLDAGSGDEAQALGVDRGRRSTARTSPPGFNPQFLLDGLTAIDEAVRRAGLHPGVQARGDQRPDRRGAGRPRLPLPADAAPPAQLTPGRLRRATRFCVVRR